MFFIFLFTPWIPICVTVLSLKQQTMAGRALAEECFWSLSDDLCIDENLCQSQKWAGMTYEQTSLRHPGLDATREHCHSWTVKATQHSSLLLLDSCHHPCHCEKFFIYFFVFEIFFNIQSPKCKLLEVQTWVMYTYSCYRFVEKLAALLDFFRRR